MHVDFSSGLFSQVGSRVGFKSSMIQLKFDFIDEAMAIRSPQVLSDFDFER